MKKKKNVITDLKDIPHAWDSSADDDCCELSLTTHRVDPFVEIYARWREFMIPLSDVERKFVRKLVCGNNDKVSKEEVDAWVKATKGQLDKGSK
jgi:hypothetical protein